VFLMSLSYSLGVRFFKLLYSELILFNIWSHRISVVICLCYAAFSWSYLNSMRSDKLILLDGDLGDCMIWVLSIIEVTYDGFSYFDS